MIEIEHIQIASGSVRLHAVAAGPSEGPLLILLHGFPEFWYGWRKQIGPLAQAGFRVIAPDQRGYNLSDKPQGIQTYAMPELIRDVISVADSAGRQRFLLAGHDWGAAVAWAAAALHPDRIERLAILNVPHPAVFLRYLRTRPRQMIRSWYMLFFQIPRLPEALISAGNFALGKRSLLLSSRKGTFTDEDLDRYREAWSRPGALTAMINWYRALFRSRPRGAGRIAAPTRIIWGEKDRFLLRDLARDSLDYCDRGELVPLREATHWVQHEEPERVNQLLIEFFKATRAGIG